MQRSKISRSEIDDFVKNKICPVCKKEYKSFYFYLEHLFKYEKEWLSGLRYILDKKGIIGEFVDLNLFFE